VHIINICNFFPEIKRIFCYRFLRRGFILLCVCCCNREILLGNIYPSTTDSSGPFVSSSWESCFLAVNTHALPLKLLIPLFPILARCLIWLNKSHIWICFQICFSCEKIFSLPTPTYPSYTVLKYKFVILSVKLSVCQIYKLLTSNIKLGQILDIA